MEERTAKEVGNMEGIIGEYTINSIQQWKVDDKTREELKTYENGLVVLDMLDRAYMGDVDTIYRLTERAAILGEYDPEPLDMVKVAFSAIGDDTRLPVMQTFTQQAPKKPEFLQVEFYNIPPELRELKRWVCWQSVLINGKWTKVPKMAADIKINASVANKNTWGTAQQAIQAYQAGGVDGIGYVFVKTDGYVGIDIDHCILPDNTLTPLAKEIVDLLHTYVELSPSNTGLHLIMRGKIQRNLKLPFFEIYNNLRYLTFTGCTDRLAITHDQAALEAVFKVVEKERRRTDPQLYMFEE